MQLNNCNDLAYEPDCRSRASQGLCETMLSNNVPIKALCPKSCNNCPSSSRNSLTCDGLVRNCNTGTCVGVSYYGVSSIQCYCPYGKGGTYCQQDNPCIYNPCLNGGRCTPMFETDQMYQCTCPAGYTGKNCEICTPRCNTVNCFNGGTCQINNANNLPYCMCPPSYSGLFCQNCNKFI